MGYASYAESISDLRCGLEYVAGFSSKPVELDTSTALAVIASAERLLGQIRAALEIATDPNLEVASEVVRLHARLIEQERQRRISQDRINDLSREIAARERDTRFWRDEYLELSHRTWAARRHARRRR